MLVWPLLNSPLRRLAHPLRISASHDDQTSPKATWVVQPPQSNLLDVADLPLNLKGWSNHLHFSLVSVVQM